MNSNTKEILAGIIKICGENIDQTELLNKKTDLVFEYVKDLERRVNQLEIELKNKLDNIDV